MSYRGWRRGFALFTILGGLSFSMQVQAGSPSDASKHTMVVKIPVASVYESPSNEAERVTQALMNDRLETFYSSGPWVKVLASDQYRTPNGYPGWVLRKHLQSAEIVSRVATDNTLKSHSQVESKLVRVCVTKALIKAAPLAQSHTVGVVYMTTALKRVGQKGAWSVVQLPGSTKHCYIESSKVVEGYLPGDGPAIVASARRFLHTPYLWGGLSANGIDCSGLVYVCFKLHGYLLPRDADQQSQVGLKVLPKNLQVGDLVYFGKNPGHVTHIGIALGQNQLIDASGHYGVKIHSLQEDYYSTGLLGARRIITSNHHFSGIQKVTELQN